MLKIITLLILTLILSQLVCGQFSTTKIANNTGRPNNGTKSYDSLMNYLGKDVYLYIGQTLYLRRIPKERRDREYFVLDKNKEFYDGSNPQYLCLVDRASLKEYNDIKNIISAEQFEKMKPNLSIECKTNFDALEHKYFNVFGVWRHPKWNEYPNEGRYYLGLIRQDNNDTCYYLYEATSSLYTFPFLVSGYFEKQKAKFLNKRFIIQGKSFLPILLIDRYRDVESGESISLNPGEEWKCIDFTLNDETEETILIVQNQSGKKMAVRYSDDILQNDVNEIFMTKSEADKIIKKYGLPVWKNILAGKLFLGWTKEMCELSWGRPNNINKTTTNYGTTEQWVYSGNYLYFTGNKLTTIQ